MTSRALFPDEAEHVVKLATGIKDPIDRAAHKQLQAFIRQIGSVHAKEMMQGIPDTLPAVPCQREKIIPDRVHGMLICHDF